MQWKINEVSLYHCSIGILVLPSLWPTSCTALACTPHFVCPYIPRINYAMENIQGFVISLYNLLHWHSLNAEPQLMPVPWPWLWPTSQSALACPPHFVCLYIPQINYAMENKRDFIVSLYNPRHRHSRNAEPRPMPMPMPL
jgi:hypothetical protein